MGGIIFMGKKVFKLIVGFVCGYMYVQWVPVSQPFHLAGFFLGLVLNPIEFLAASISFTVGFLLNGELIRETIFIRLKSWRKKVSLNDEALIGIGVIVGMLILFNLGSVQTAVFFSISFIYGMISLKY
jgi:hypothetical protein